MKNDKKEIYDIIIIGAGPAGITASIYASRTGLKNLIIEKSKVGGQICETYSIENYPGFELISGKELSLNMEKQLKATTTKLVFDEVQDANLTSEIKEIKCYKNTYYTKAVIIACGTSVRTLDINTQSKYLGRGISYSANSDRDKYIGKMVAVVGGGNTSLEDALYLSEKAHKVYLIHRRDRYRADDLLVNRINNCGNIEQLKSSNILDLVGKNNLEEIIVQNMVNKTKTKLKIDCLFVAIGRGASIDFIDDPIEKTPDGFIVANSKMETSIEGVYVAGDIRNTELRQIVSATSDGAVAATNAYNFLMKKVGKSYD